MSRFSSPAQPDSFVAPPLRSGSRHSSVTVGNEPTQTRAYGQSLSRDASRLSAAQSPVLTGDKKDEKKNKKGAEIKAADDLEYVEEVDGVWGKLGEGTPNYKNVGW